MVIKFTVPQNWDVSRLADQLSGFKGEFFFMNYAYPNT